MAKLCHVAYQIVPEIINKEQKCPQEHICQIFRSRDLGQNQCCKFSCFCMGFPVFFVSRILQLYSFSACFEGIWPCSCFFFTNCHLQPCKIGQGSTNFSKALYKGNKTNMLRFWQNWCQIVPFDAVSHNKIFFHICDLSVYCF